MHQHRYGIFDLDNTVQQIFADLAQTRKQRGSDAKNNVETEPFKGAECRGCKVALQRAVGDQSPRRFIDGPGGGQDARVDDMAGSASNPGLMSSGPGPSSMPNGTGFPSVNLHRRRPDRDASRDAAAARVAGTAAPGRQGSDISPARLSRSTHPPDRSAQNPDQVCRRSRKQLPLSSSGSIPAQARAPDRNLGELPDSLPRFEVVIDLEDKTYPGRSELQRVGESRAEMLDIVPARLRIKVIRRPRYTCQACDTPITQTPAPPRPIKLRWAMKFPVHLLASETNSFSQHHLAGLP